MIPPTPPRTPRRSVLLRILATLVAAAPLAACNPAPVPTPTPTAAFASDEEAFAAAEETYRAYTDALNAVDLSDPTTFEAVFRISSGDFEAADRKTLSELHAAGYAFVGRMSVVYFEGLRTEPPFKEVLAIVCIDVSASDVVDGSGQSVTEPDRPDVNPLRVTFRHLEQGFVVDHADREPEAKCAT